MSVVKWLRKIFICIALTLLYHTSAAFGCLYGEVGCNCSVSDFQVSSDPVGPGNPKLLNTVVEFNASAKWAPDASIGMKIYVKDVLVEEFPSMKNPSFECGMTMSRTFKVTNGRTVRANPSGFAVVDVVIYVDQVRLNPTGGSLECANPMCVRLQIHYHFSPSPANIEIKKTPKDAREGHEATISCSTKDGNPEVKYISILFFNLDSGKEMFEVPASTIRMTKAIRAKYICQVINFPLGEQEVVQSLESVYVLAKSEETTIDSIMNWNSLEENLNISNGLSLDTNITGNGNNISNTIQGEERQAGIQTRNNQSVETGKVERPASGNISVAKESHQVSSGSFVTIPNLFIILAGVIDLYLY